MKGSALILLSMLFSTAHAVDSWVVTKCSNSDGTVKWESGVEDESLIHLRYSNFVEGTLSLPVEKVSIQFSKDITIRENAFRNCQVKGKGRVFAGKVKIVAADKHPNVLRSQFPENKVQTEVICTTVETEPSDCSEE